MQSFVGWQDMVLVFACMYINRITHKCCVYFCYEYGKKCFRLEVIRLRINEVARIKRNALLLE